MVVNMEKQVEQAASTIVNWFNCFDVRPCPSLPPPLFPLQSSTSSIDIHPIYPTMPTRGALIAIEGLDRAGKSTQCDILLKRLEEEGIKARLQKFPGSY